MEHEGDRRGNLILLLNSKGALRWSPCSIARCAVAWGSVQTASRSDHSTCIRPPAGCRIASLCLMQRHNPSGFRTTCAVPKMRLTDDQ